MYAIRAITNLLAAFRYVTRLRYALLCILNTILFLSFYTKKTECLVTFKYISAQRSFLHAHAYEFNNNKKFNIRPSRYSALAASSAV